MSEGKIQIFINKNEINKKCALEFPISWKVLRN